LRIKGKITHWNPDKAYGFITPASGAKEVFVHIKAFSDRSAAPAVGQLVSFSEGTDRQGRPCALRVTLVNELPAGAIGRNDDLLWSLVAGVFLLFVANGSLAPLPHLHEPAQQAVDAGLVTGALAAEPLEYIGIEPNRDGLLDRGSPFRFTKEGLVQLREVAQVDVLVRPGGESVQFSFQFPFQSVRVPDGWPFGQRGFE
jgi:cold shock CspA family protein